VSASQLSVSISVKCQHLS